MQAILQQLVEVQWCEINDKMNSFKFGKKEKPNFTETIAESI